MRRVLPWILLALVVLGVAHPLLTYGRGEQQDSAEQTRIPRYDAVFEVDDNGDLDVVETIEVDVTSDDRHGIYRFFDETDPRAPHARRVPEVSTVTRDGVAEPYSWSTTAGGRFHTLQIGDEDVTLAEGVHTYVLRYTMDGVLTPADGGAEGPGARFVWDVVPGGWAQPIDSARLTVRLPDRPASVDCAVVATTGPERDCAPDDAASTTLVVELSDLEPLTRVTLDAALPDLAPSPDELPWTPRAATILGSQWRYVAIVGLGVLYAGWLGRRLSRRTIEAPVQAPLQYAPPSGLGPHQALFVATEKVSDSVFVAALMHAAALGAVRIERDGDGAWRVEPLDAGVVLDPITRQVLVDLDIFIESGDRGPGDAEVRVGRTLQVRHHDADDGARLQAVREAAVSATRGWALREGYLEKSGPGALGAVGVIAGFAAYLLLVWLGVPGTAVALIPGVYAVMGVAMLFPGSTTVRTDAGRRVWAHTEGFRLALASPSWQQPFDFDGREHLQPRYLPWAVAFGNAEEWSLKFREETGHMPPEPVWLVGAGIGAGGVAVASSLAADFDACVSGAVSAYSASQASSGGSGTGASSGGGGGGGGGSW